MLRITEKQYREYMQRLGLQPDEVVMSKETKKKPKYRNVKVYVYEDGYVSHEPVQNHGGLADRFDSIKEYNRYRELVLLEKAGIISNLQKQVPMVIQEAFIDNDGKKQRAIIYKADFIYIKDGEEVVEDVKGYDMKKTKIYMYKSFYAEMENAKSFISK